MRLTHERLRDLLALLLVMATAGIVWATLPAHGLPEARSQAQPTPNRMLASAAASAPETRR